MNTIQIGRKRLSEIVWGIIDEKVGDNTVFVLDDFEGVEKGVVNALMIESGLRVLIYPRDGRKTAISLPMSLLRVVPQEAT